MSDMVAKCAFLDSAWIEHHTDLASNSLWWQILSELGADNAYTAMGTGDLAPDYAIIATLFQSLCLVNICQSLSEVELSLSLGLDSCNLDKGCVRVLIGLATLVAEEVPRYVKSNTFSSHCYLKQVICLHVYTNIVEVDTEGRGEHIDICFPSK